MAGQRMNWNRVKNESMMAKWGPANPYEVKQAKSFRANHVGTCAKCKGEIAPGRWCRFEKLGLNPKSQIVHTDCNLPDLVSSESEPTRVRPPVVLNFAAGHRPSAPFPAKYQDECPQCRGEVLPGDVVITIVILIGGKERKRVAHPACVSTEVAINETVSSESELTFELPQCKKWGAAEGSI